MEDLQINSIQENIQILEQLDNQVPDHKLLNIHKPEVKSILLNDLFTLELNIPEYQRPYIWKEKDIIKLLNQIELHEESNVNGKPLFYLGSIVLHKQYIDNRYVYNIIDGQQRITSLAIINYICNQTECSLQYENIISQKNIKNNFLQFINKQSQIEFIDFNKINVTVIITDNEDDAYNFFETLNTGGKRLSGVDILKAHHLRSTYGDEQSEYAVLWEKEQKHIEDVIKLLLRGRKWSILDFKNVPSKRGSLSEWKNIITYEFIDKVIKNVASDNAFSSWKKDGLIYEQMGNHYSLRQPLSEGKNFMNYLFSYIEIYKKLFIKKSSFNDNVINFIDGTIDLKAGYQLCMLCYAAKFGVENAEKNKYWIFRFIYSLRVGEKSRVLEISVVNHIKSYNIVDRILYSSVEDEVLNWLKKYNYDFDVNNIKGVKARFIERISIYFNIQFKLVYSDYDKQLISKFNGNKYF